MKYRFYIDEVGNPGLQASDDPNHRFGGKIAGILEESKYNRSPAGEIDGWGRKWLP